MKPFVSYKLTDLAAHAAREVCVIKNVLPRPFCGELTAEILQWQKERPENQDRGRNWWYTVKKENTAFDSFLFNELENLLPGSLRSKLSRIYGKIFESHVLCGTLTGYPDFDTLLKQRGSGPALNPLIFLYKPGTGQFRKHSHEAGFQKTQILINITKKGEDYSGGDTRIDLDNGESVNLGDFLDQGDLFSFPYTLFHSVSPVESPAGQGGRGRISVLMPFHPHSGGYVRYR